MCKAVPSKLTAHWMRYSMRGGELCLLAPLPAAICRNNLYEPSIEYQVRRACNRQCGAAKHDNGTLFPGCPLGACQSALHGTLPKVCLPTRLPSLVCLVKEALPCSVCVCADPCLHPLFMKERGCAEP